MLWYLMIVITKVKYKRPYSKIPDKHLDKIIIIL